MISALAGEYRDLGTRVFGSGDVPEMFARLRDDPALRWSSGEEMLDAARIAVERAEAVAPQWFRTVPSWRCQVSRVPEEAADAGAMAYYVEPTVDGSRPGTYYLDTADPRERFRHVSEALAFHEAVPGHHFQIATALGLTGLPLLRRLAECTAYAEGWGLYAE